MGNVNLYGRKHIVQVVSSEYFQIPANSCVTIQSRIFSGKLGWESGHPFGVNVLRIQ